MAVITTTLAPEPDYFPLVGIQDQPQQQSYLPKGLMLFAIGEVSANIPASGAGDSQFLIVNCELPRGFAYALQDCHFDIQGTDADAWLPATRVTLSSNATTALARTFIMTEVQSIGVAAIGTNLRTYGLVNPMKSLMIVESKAAAGHFGILITNETLNQSAITFHMYVSLVQYNIEQAHHVRVNTPQIVR